MTLQGYLKLVEIQTKVASVIPFAMGTLYALYRYETFNARNFSLMLISLLCIDMATTAINNYQDYKKAIKKQGYGYEGHNAIVRYNMKQSHVVAVILLLLGLATAAGVMLFLSTDIIVLLLGAFSFLIGILYTSGPVPISRTPFGELFSGGVMGFIIPFLAAYIHVFDRNLVVLDFQNTKLLFSASLPDVLYLLSISLPAAAGIANIMLANNICDIEDDIANRRYTLPIYIGKANALKVFRTLYYSGFAMWILLLTLRVVPLVSGLVLLTAIPVQKNLQVFHRVQNKEETFVLAVKNFVLVNASIAVTLGIALLIQAI